MNASDVVAVWGTLWGGCTLHPGNSDQYQNRGLAGIGVCKNIKTKDMRIDSFGKIMREFEKGSK
jgi:hypothetical protein